MNLKPGTYDVPSAYGGSFVVVGPDPDAGYVRPAPPVPSPADDPKTCPGCGRPTELLAVRYFRDRRRASEGVRICRPCEVGKPCRGCDSTGHVGKWECHGCRGTGVVVAEATG